ncbi:MAG: NAD-binding oxidoreductase, partial [Ruthenibacterium lactatiformans]
MYKILEKTPLNPTVTKMVIEAPLVAKKAEPGQFIIFRASEDGERVPLTVADYDRTAGTVTIVTQTIGVSTRKICALEAGSALADFAGPLGHPSEFITLPPEALRGRRYLFVAGGVGTAPVYPQVKWLHEHGVGADVIVGAKTRD